MNIKMISAHVITTHSTLPLRSALNEFHWHSAPLPMYSGKPVIKLGRLPPLSWVPYFKSYHIPVFISNITLKKVTLFPRFLSSWTNCSTDIELTHAEPIISVLFLSVLLLVVLLECFSWRSRPLFCRGLSLFRGIWRTFLIGDRNQVFHNIIT